MATLSPSPAVLYSHLYNCNCNPISKSVACVFSMKLVGECTLPGSAYSTSCVPIYVLPTFCETPKNLPGTQSTNSWTAAVWPGRLSAPLSGAHHLNQPQVTAFNLISQPTNKSHHLKLIYFFLSHYIHEWRMRVSWLLRSNYCSTSQRLVCSRSETRCLCVAVTIRGWQLASGPAAAQSDNACQRWQVDVRCKRHECHQCAFPDNLKMTD